MSSICAGTTNRAKTQTLIKSIQGDEMETESDDCETDSDEYETNRNVSGTYFEKEQTYSTGKVPKKNMQKKPKATTAGREKTETINKLSKSIPVTMPQTQRFVSKEKIPPMVLESNRN